MTRKERVAAVVELAADQCHIPLMTVQHLEVEADEMITKEEIAADKDDRIRILQDHRPQIVAAAPTQTFETSGIFEMVGNREDLRMVAGMKKIAGIHQTVEERIAGRMKQQE